MNKSSIENEKDKETEKTSEEEDYEDDEREEVENAQEGSQLEEDALSEESLFADTNQIAGSLSESEGEEEAEPSLEFQKRREKWLTVTGRRPRNIPVIKRYMDVDADRIILFGDRRQIEVDKKIAERMLLATKNIGTRTRNMGKVLKEVWLPALSNGLMCLKFDPVGETLATADRTGEAQIRRSNTGEIIMRMTAIEGTERLPIRVLRFHPLEHNSLYLAGETGIVQIFSKETGLLQGAGENITTIYCMDINSNGSFLVTGGGGGKIHIVDPNTLQVCTYRKITAFDRALKNETTCRVELMHGRGGMDSEVVSKRTWPQLDETTSSEVSDQFHRLRVYAVKFHPENENIFVTGSGDRTVKIWDTRVPTATKSINGPAVFGEGLDLSNNVILTAAWQAEKSVGLWDFPSGKLIKHIPIKNQYTKFDGEFLFTGQFFKNNPVYPSVTSNFIAVGGGGFTQLLVINIKNEKVSAHFPSYKPVFCLDLFGSFVAYGGKESVFRIGELRDMQKDVYLQ